MRTPSIVLLAALAACAAPDAADPADDFDLSDSETSADALFDGLDCADASVCTGASQSRKQCYGAGLNAALTRSYETVQTFDVPATASYNFLRIGLNRPFAAKADSGVLRVEIRELVSGLANLSTSPVRAFTYLAASRVSTTAAIHELYFDPTFTLSPGDGVNPRYALVITGNGGPGFYGLACNDSPNVLASGAAYGRRRTAPAGGSFNTPEFKAGPRDLAFALGYRSPTRAGPCSRVTGATCDDGNQVDGDGCSASCTVETGFACAGQPSTCGSSAVNYAFTSEYTFLPAQDASFDMSEETATGRCLITHVKVGPVEIANGAAFDRIGTIMFNPQANQSGPIYLNTTCADARARFAPGHPKTALIYPDGSAIQIVLYAANGEALINWYSPILTGIVTDGPTRRYNDGTFATSCAGYRTGEAGHTYEGATGSAIYRIDPDGTGGASPFDVYCDMDTAGGGWRIVSRSVTADPSFAFGGAVSGTLGGSAWNTDATGLTFSQVLLKYAADARTATLTGPHTWSGSGARVATTTSGEYFEYILRDHHGSASHVCLGPKSTPYGGLGGDICTRVYTNGGDNGQLGFGLGTAMNVNSNFDDRAGFMWNNAVVTNVNGATISTFDVGVK